MSPMSSSRRTTWSCAGGETKPTTHPTNQPTNQPNYQTNHPINPNSQNKTYPHAIASATMEPDYHEQAVSASSVGGATGSAGASGSSEGGGGGGVDFGAGGGGEMIVVEGDEVPITFLSEWQLYVDFAQRIHITLNVEPSFTIGMIKAILSDHCRWCPSSASAFKLTELYNDLLTHEAYGVKDQDRVILTMRGRGAAKQVIHKMTVPLMTQERLDYLINRFRKVHSSRTDADLYANLTASLQEANRLIQDLASNPQLRLLKQGELGMQELNDIEELCKPFDAARKVPLLARRLLPTVNVLITHHDGIRLLGNQVLEAGLTSLVRMFNACMGAEARPKKCPPLWQLNIHPSVIGCSLDLVLDLH